MRQRLWRLAAVIIAGVLALAAFVGSGLVSIKASSGHWAITSWVLDFAKRRSVALHSFGIDEPRFDDPALVLRGAGHYETGCRSCHGRPTGPMPRIPAGMTPHPPPLASQVQRWQPRELFYIVRHGIKFTGMPAWPADGREDEVWAVVAFLLTLPEMDGTQYDELVFGHSTDRVMERHPDADATARLAATRCARCHGADGLGREGADFPKIGGQRRGYLVRALHAYADGMRPSGIMQPIAAELTHDERAALAAYYAERPSASALTVVARDTDVGRRLAERGLPDRDVPPCAECHGPRPRDRNPAYPILDGQVQDYLIQQLELFAEDRRGGSEFAHLMQRVAPRLTHGEMEAVTAYYASRETR